MHDFQFFWKSKINQIFETENGVKPKYSPEWQQAIVKSNQNSNHQSDRSVQAPSFQSQSCPYCIQKHLPVYITCASPLQLVRPHLTYLTPESPFPSSPFCPFGPEGPSIPASPLGPMSPEKSFILNVLFFVFYSVNVEAVRGGAV